MLPRRCSGVPSRLLEQDHEECVRTAFAQSDRLSANQPRNDVHKVISLKLVEQRELIDWRTRVVRQAVRYAVESAVSALRNARRTILGKPWHGPSQTVLST